MLCIKLVCYGTGSLGVGEMVHIHPFYDLLHRPFVSLCKGDFGQLGQGSVDSYWYPPPSPIRLNGDFVPIGIVTGCCQSCSLSLSTGGWRVGGMFGPFILRVDVMVNEIGA